MTDDYRPPQSQSDRPLAPTRRESARAAALRALAASWASRRRRVGNAAVGQEMASTRQVRAAKENVQKAQQAARQKRTIANLPESTRHELGKQAAKGRQRGGRAGHALEDRNREQLYEIAKEQNIRGRSKMGKWDLIEAIRRSR